MLREAVVVLDFETTGLDVDASRLIEVAALRIESGRVTACLETLVRAEQHVPRDVVQLTGIDDAMLAGAPSVRQVVPRLVDFIRDAPVFAHNADFDQRILENELQRQGRRWQPAGFLCTRRVASRILPGLTSYALAPLMARCQLAFDGPEHRAMGDCRATARLLLDLVQRVEALRGAEADLQLLRSLANGPSPETAAGAAQAA